MHCVADLLQSGLIQCACSNLLVCIDFLWLYAPEANLFLLGEGKKTLYKVYKLCHVEKQKHYFKADELEKQQRD